MERTVKINPDLMASLEAQDKFAVYFRKTHLQVFRFSQNNGKFTISEIFSHSLTDQSNRKIIASLKKLLIPSADLILPRESYVSKRLTLPAGDFKEARQMALLKLPKLSPFSPEDSLSEVTFVGKGQEGYFQVNLWIINKKILFKYLYILGQAGILVNKTRMDIDGLPGLWKKHRPENAPYMVILQDQSCIHLVIVKENVILSSRMFTLTASPSDEQNTAAHEITLRERLLNEAGKFIKFTHEEFAEERPEKIFIYNEQMPFLFDAEFIEGIPVERLSYKETSLDAPEETGPFPVHIIFSSLKKDNMDFLPENYNEMLSRITRMKKVVKVLSFIAVFVIAFSLIFTVRFTKKNSQLRSLKEKLNKIEKDAASVKMLHNRILKAADIQKRQMLILDSLKEIIRLMNRSMRLRSFSIDNNNEIIISGQANSSKDVYDFTKKIRDLSLFPKVNSKDIKSKKIKGKDVYIFKIIIMSDPVQNKEGKT